MIAIHVCAGSFSDRWIEFCVENNIQHILVDMYSSNIINLLKNANVSALLSHPQMADRATRLAARSILKSCNLAGITTYPSLPDFWHFDDKVAQKYIFEALGVSSPKTFVCFDRGTALQWIETANYPLVFKLKAGAGSINVSLVRNKKEALKIIKIMFGRGYVSTDGAIKDISTKFRSHRLKRDWQGTLMRLPKTLKNLYDLRQGLDRERGYVYFQEFIPQNDHDTRVAVIGKRAFAFRRGVRPGDFRASGSGFLDYTPTKINHEYLKLAFDTAHLLGSECVAFDFISRPDSGEPLIVEMSFGFMPNAIYDCPGYWDRELAWYPGNIWPQDAILNDLSKTFIK